MLGATRSGLVWAAAVAVILFPVPVRADGYVTPWIGSDLADSTDNGHSAFGVTTGYMGWGVFGFEADFGYSPEFFGSSDLFGNNTAFTAMGNVILGVPIGGTDGAGVRPFVSGGLGLMRTHIEGGTIVKVPLWNNAFGYDLGAGMMGFFNQHVGLRGDVRYLSTVQESNQASAVLLGLGKLHYWRVSGGVTFR
jgi:hypothetical protein